MTYNVLVPDSLHINTRNFPSFFKFVEREKVQVTFVSDRKDWVALYGDYSIKLDVLNDKIKKLNTLSMEQLFEMKVREVNLFFVARAEILSLIIKNDEWVSEAISKDRLAIFQKMYTYNRDILIQCLAAAWDWVEYWYTFLQDNKLFTHSCIFSGSLIYQRTLIELLRYRPTRVLLMESFFTGNDYYCEEKYEPIANNCDIRYKSIFNSLLKDLSPNEIERETTKAINKIIMAKNKNVIQPLTGEPILFENNSPIVTILGQVVNDFSLLEYKGKGLSSIPFYKELILALISKGFNVVFKAHPWEAKKINITDSFTKNKIGELRDSLSVDEKRRLVIVDDYPISNLFSISDYIVGLNSQGMIESAFEGFKPIQFGNAFYGNKGFTNDYDYLDISSFIDDLCNNNVRGTMNLEEYDLFQIFLLKILQGQLVSIHNSGIPKLCEIFKSYPTIKLTTQNKNNLQLTACKTLEKKKITEDDSLILEETVKSDELSKFNRKTMKFKRDPRRFFAESKSPLLRPFSKLFRAK